MSKPEQPSSSSAHQSPSFSHDWCKQPRPWVKHRSSHKLQCGAQRCRDTQGVFVNSVATCTWATWGWAGWTSKLLCGEERLREASPNAPLHLFPTYLQWCFISKHAGKNPSVLHGQLHLPASRDAAWAKLPIGFYFQIQFIMDCITSPWMCWS